MHTDLYHQLKQEHEEVKKILENLAKTTIKTAKTRDELLEKLSQKLIPHMEAEEEVFYPALMEKKAFAEDALEAYEEHHAARIVFDELHNLAPEKENWGAKLRVLKEMIEHHIMEEEHKIFSDAREALSHEQVQDILQRFKEMEEKHLHVMV